MAEGFLGRWSQRKQAVREGKPLEESAVLPPAQPAAVSGSAGPQAPEPTTGAAFRPQADAGPDSVAAPPAPPPTLQEVQALTPQSDFTRFMRSDVDPEVKNAAMKKLFADPHFNVMDGLDIYIDDYNKPDPMPASMLRKLASAQFLKLFDEEKQDNPTSAAVRPLAAAPATPAVPSVGVPASDPIAHDHDNTDLRLQQDHAAGPQGPGRGVE